MTQKINPARLKNAAEHLEWVFKQHQDVEVVRRLHQSLASLIEDAKALRLREPVIGLPLPRFHPTESWPTTEGKQINQAFLDFFLEIRGDPARRSVPDRDESTLEACVKYILGFPEKEVVELFQEADRLLKQPHHLIDKQLGNSLAQRLESKAMDLSSSRATEMSPLIPELIKMASELVQAINTMPSTTGALASDLDQ